MKKLLLIAVLSIQLTGCVWQTTNQWDIERAINICGSSDKIAEMDVHFNGTEYVTCKNGKRINLGEYKE